MQDLVAGFSIIEGFLPKPVFQLVSDAANEVPLFIPDDSDPEAIWGTNRGRNPRASKGILKPLVYTDRQILVASGFETNVFPTNTSLDHALTFLEQYLITHLSFGVPHKDWAGLIASIFCFQRGSGLPWHRDNIDYAGAFVLYLHKDWAQESGGELMIGGSDKQNKVVMVEPLPNRLVLIDSGVRHSVNTVQGNGLARMTLSGFAIRTERVPYLLQRFSAWHATPSDSTH